MFSLTRPLSLCFSKILVPVTACLLAFAPLQNKSSAKGAVLQQCSKMTHSSESSNEVGHDSNMECLIAGAKAMLSSASTWSLEEDLIEDDSFQWLADNEKIIDKILASSLSSPTAQWQE